MTQEKAQSQTVKPSPQTVPILAALVVILLAGGLYYARKKITPAPTAPSPSAAVVHYKTGLSLAQKGDLTGASNEWQTAIALEPGYAPPYLALVKKFEQEGDFAGAVKQLDALRRADARAPHIECRQAGLYFKANRYETALATAREALKREPDCPQAHTMFGALVAKAGDWKQAAQELETAHRAAPEETAITLALAVVWGHSGKANEGIALLESLPEAVRNSPPALYRQGWLLAEYGRNGQKDDRTALEALNQALAKAPEDPDTNALVGTIQLRAGNIEQARASFVRALQSDNGNVRAARGMATILMRQKNPQATRGQQVAALLEARETGLQKARGRYLAQPQDIPNTLKLAELEAQNGNRNDALALIKTALQQDPNNAATLALLHRLTKSVKN